MYPVLFKVGSLTFYSHGLFIVIGIIAGAALVYGLSRKKMLSSVYFLDNIIYTALIGVIGARITYFVLYPHQFKSLSQIVLLWDGGLVSYGGFIFGALALILLLKAQKQPILQWLDLFSIGLPLGLLFGRIGDLLAGDYGVISGGSNFFAVHFIPTPLLEASLCAFLVLLLLSVLLVGKDRIRTGALLVLSILIYSGGRFIIDFWRGERPIIWILSSGQLFSLIVFVFTLLFVLISRSKRRIR